MTKIGKLYVCDRCGQTGFAEYDGPMQRNGLIDPLCSYYKNSKAGRSGKGRTCARIAPKSITCDSKVFGRRKRSEAYIQSVC